MSEKNLCQCPNPATELGRFLGCKEEMSSTEFKIIAFILPYVGSQYQSTDIQDLRLVNTHMNSRLPRIILRWWYPNVTFYNVNHNAAEVLTSLLHPADGPSLNEYNENKDGMHYKYTVTLLIGDKGVAQTDPREFPLGEYCLLGTTCHSDDFTGSVQLCGHVEAIEKAFNAREESRDPADGDPTLDSPFDSTVIVTVYVVNADENVFAFNKLFFRWAPEFPSDGVYGKEEWIRIYLKDQELVTTPVSSWREHADRVFAKLRLSVNRNDKIISTLLQFDIEDMNTDSRDADNQTLLSIMGDVCLDWCARVMPSRRISEQEATITALKAHTTALEAKLAAFAKLEASKRTVIDGGKSP